MRRLMVDGLPAFLLAHAAKREEVTHPAAAGRSLPRGLTQTGLPADLHPAGLQLVPMRAHLGLMLEKVRHNVSDTRRTGVLSLNPKCLHPGRQQVQQLHKVGLG